jgi:hypothetical protein
MNIREGRATIGAPPNPTPPLIKVDFLFVLENSVISIKSIA